MYINCGWGTGGFKAIPGSGWATAEMIKEDAGDPVIVQAIKDIELNYAPDEPEPAKKKRKRKNKNDIDEVAEMINGSERDYYWWCGCS